jgi:bifunctional DNase/RNase
VEGIFYSKIVCSNGEKEIEIDSRTSDAIAIALRFNCPIYTFDFILSSAGIALEGDTSSSDIFGEISNEELEDESTVNEFSRYSDEQLDELLEKTLEEEEYEKASRIRDEMKNRGKL